MSMDWHYLRPQCAKSAVAALAFAGLIHFTSPVHFFVATAVLLLAWPVTDIIIESIASKNPNTGERVIIKGWWPVAFKWALLITASAGLCYWASLPLMTAFAYSLLVFASIGAINGIAIELEDTMPLAGLTQMAASSMAVLRPTRQSIGPTRKAAQTGYFEH